MTCIISDPHNRPGVEVQVSEAVWNLTVRAAEAVVGMPAELRQLLRDTADEEAALRANRKR